MKTKYGTEPWFQEKLHIGCISTKDALKFSLVYPLENLLVSELFHLIHFVSWNARLRFYALFWEKNILFLRILKIPDLLCLFFFHIGVMFLPIILYKIEVLQDCKLIMNSFRIRLTYSHTDSSKEAEKCSDCNESCKRRKTGMSKFTTILYVFSLLDYKLHMFMVSTKSLTIILYYDNGILLRAFYFLHISLPSKRIQC